MTFRRDEDDRHVISAFVRRIVFYAFIVIVTAYFFVPLLWLIVAPFDRVPSLDVKAPEFTLDNFTTVLFENPHALRSLGNSVILAGATMLLVVATATPAAYALSRVQLPGRDLLLYLLLLFSSIVTGSAAMVPLFVLIFNLGLINTYLGVVLVLAGGLLPAAIFILKDFTDSTRAATRSRPWSSARAPSRSCATPFCRSSARDWPSSRCGSWSTCGATS